MSEWQPIETAPRDGTRILVLAMSKYVHIASHATFYSQFGCAELTGWWDRQDWFLDKVTHWMCLPEPPK